MDLTEDITMESGIYIGRPNDGHAVGIPHACKSV